MLEALTHGVWTVQAPQTFMGLHVGSRMTVVRLEDGGLLLHSPIAMDTHLKKEIDGLGPVSHIVCPNLYHHLHAGDAKKLWPNALLHGPEKLHRKRRDLSFDGVFNERQTHPQWGGLRLLSIEGTMLGETVMLHKASGTLISVDLIENFQSSPHWPTRCYLKISGLHGKPGWSWMGRWMYRDRKQARADVNRLLAFDFDRLIVAHGDIVTSNAQQTIRKGLDWLL